EIKLKDKCYGLAIGGVHGHRPGEPLSIPATGQGYPAVDQCFQPPAEKASRRLRALETLGLLLILFLAYKMIRKELEVDLYIIRKMVNTRTDADLSAAVQNALQTLLPQIRAEIREEFRTSSGPSDAGGNPPPVTIHTWLERFNK
nr:hypothetical protein [Tanacetum cinerariifolium]